MPAITTPAKKPILANTDAQTLFDTINYQLRHQDYDHVIEVAADYTAYATGTGMDRKLRQFIKRENDTDFKQRLALTQVNTPDIFNSCVKPLYKVGRTPANVAIHWENKDAKATEENKKRLLDVGKNFWGKKSVEKYITQRQADLDSTDPNSFVIVEFKGKVDPAKPETKAKPYPFEANSAEAINFRYQNNDLQWLIVLNSIFMEDGKGKLVEGEKYYGYYSNHNIVATQIHKDNAPNFAGLDLIDSFDPASAAPLVPGKQYLLKTWDTKTESKKRFYIVEVFEHLIGFVPAKRFGSIYDPLTRGRTCIPVIFAAKSYFEKSIKTMSEFDLTNCLHVFPQKLQYTDPCPGEQLESGWIGCQNGLRPDGKTKCGACHGTGYKVHNSAQDIIYIRMPKEIKDIVSLENVIAYKHPPIDLLEFQKTFGFYELRQLAQGAVYNSDVFSKAEVAKTALEKSIDLDAVYDTLTVFADTWSEMYEHIYRCIAVLQDIGEGLTINHKFPSDFKMEPLGTLMDFLTKANTSGASSYVKKAINKKLTYKIYIDDPREILKIETKDKFYPFPGKTETEIQFILANGMTTRFNQTLYSHFDLIFSELEYEQGVKSLDFYNLEENAQRDLIKQKVDELNAAIDLEESAANAASFSAAPENTGNTGANPNNPPTLDNLNP
jgi:hypothetical protein